MSKRNDMITRVAYRFKLQYVFFDVDSRKEVLTYGSVISRKNETVFFISISPLFLYAAGRHGLHDVGL